MIEITATGDTTLHTAGTYCAEDILVKVPVASSGSGGASGSIETCTFDFVDTLDGSRYIARISYTTVNDNGDIVVSTLSDMATTSISVTCLCNTIVAVTTTSATTLAFDMTDCSLLEVDNKVNVFALEAEAGGMAYCRRVSGVHSGGSV